MNAAERRIKITHLLAQSDGPVSATALAAQCGVSRQIIVGDVALLRAGGLAPRRAATSWKTPPRRSTRNAASSAIMGTTACATSCIRSSIWAAR